MDSLNCKQKIRKWKFVPLVYILDMSRVNSQAIYAMNTRDTSTESFEFGWELMMSLIKSHMSNRMWVSLVILRNPSGYTLIKLERSIPHLPLMLKHEYVKYARKKSTVQVTKKRLTLWGKSKHVIVNVLTIYVGSISLSFVKHALKASKTTT